TLLLGASLRHPEPGSYLLWIGTAFLGVVCVLSFVSRAAWQESIGPSVIALYLVGLAWMWVGNGYEDWYIHLSKAILLVVPLIFFGLQTLAESGAPALRRANLLAKRLADRKEWPADLSACRSLPEVKAFRGTLG